MNKNNQAYATFTEFICHNLQNTLSSELSKPSIQADATTDAGHIEVELYMPLHFDPFTTDGRVHVQNPFFVW